MQSTEGAMPIVCSWLSLELSLCNTLGNSAPRPPPPNCLPMAAPNVAFLLLVTQSMCLHRQQWI